MNVKVIWWGKKGKKGGKGKIISDFGMTDRG
jgi:hypothetical protein